MSDDILAKIDAAVGCHSCAGVLADDSPSGDFCSAECQTEWHAGHVVPLTGYREPWHRPDEFPGVGTEAFRPAVQEPASVGSWYARMSDLGESAGFELVPTGRWGRVTVSNPGWPVIDWSRTPVYTSEFGSELVPVDPADAAETWSRGWSVGYGWVDEVAELTGLMPVAAARERMGLQPVEEDAGDEVSVPTVQERALEARRTRNTGPAVRRRAPRRIDAPRSR
jgi:hypothetical protein